MLWKKADFAHSTRKLRNCIQSQLETARASIARVCKLNTAPPYDIDFVPIHMHCSNPNCKLYLSCVEEDRADVLDGLCMKCFRELPEPNTTHKPFERSVRTK